MDIEKRDFFISYNKADNRWAKWITAVLEDTQKEDGSNYKCYVQAWDFRKGDNFILNMQEALLNSDRFIAVLSEDYLNSVYCQAEWSSAFITYAHNSEKNSVFIPIRIADIAPKGLLEPICYIDLFGLKEDEAKLALIRGVDMRDIPRNKPPFPGE